MRLTGEIAGTTDDDAEVKNIQLDVSGQAQGIKVVFDMPSFKIQTETEALPFVNVALALNGVDFVECDNTFAFK